MIPLYLGCFNFATVQDSTIWANDTKDGIVGDLIDQLLTTLFKQYEGTLCYQNTNEIPILEKVTYEMMKEIILSDQFKEEVEVNWIKKSTGMGFKELPSYYNNTFNISSPSFQLKNKKEKVLLKKIGKDHYMFANGYGCKIVYDTHIQEAIDELNKRGFSTKLNTEIKKILVSWNSIIPKKD